MEWHLVCLTPKTIREITDFPVCVGRAAGEGANTIVLGNPGISRSQFMLSLRGGEVFADNLSTTNPTFLDGEEMAGSARLEAGRTYVFGVGDVAIAVGTDADEAFQAAVDNSADLYMVEKEGLTYGPFEKKDLLLVMGKDFFDGGERAWKMRTPESVWRLGDLMAFSDAGVGLPRAEEVEGMEEDGETADGEGAGGDAGLKAESDGVARVGEAGRPRRRRAWAAAGVGAVCAVAAAVGAGIAAGIWVKRMAFERRCEAVAAELERACGQDGGIAALERMLGELKVGEGEVYADTRVSVYEGRLNGLKRAKRAEERREAAKKARDAIVEKAGRAAERLESEYAGEGLDGLAERMGMEVVRWREEHGANAPEAAGDVNGAERRVKEAAAKRRGMLGAVKRLQGARDAHAALEAREELRRKYGGYAFAAGMGDCEVSAAEARAVMRWETGEMREYRRATSPGPSGKEFAAFLEECVAPLREYPLEHSLWGIYFTDGGGERYVAIAKGRPKAVRTLGGNRMAFRGEILDLRKRRMVDEFICTYAGTSVPKMEELEACGEVKRIASLARYGRVAPQKFEETLLKMAEGHLKAAADSGYVRRETGIGALVRGHLPAIRRVRLMGTYFGWLRDDLGMAPEGGALKELISRTIALGRSVPAGDAPAELAWACLGYFGVRQRNGECAELLKEFPAGFAEEYREWRRGKEKMGEIARWRVEMVARVGFDPGKAEVRGGIEKFGTAQQGKPVYALRKRGGRIVLAKAARWDGDRLTAERSVENELLAGEPLVQVLSAGNAVDAADEAEKLARNAEGGAGEYLLKKVPLIERTENGGNGDAGK